MIGKVIPEIEQLRAERDKYKLGMTAVEIERGKLEVERDRLLVAKFDLVAQVAKQERALREFVAAAEKAKKAHIVPESVLDVLGYQKGSDHE